MASVRKLNPNDPKSPWIVTYTDAAGKRRQKTPKTGLKKDADALRQKIEREMGDGVHVAISETVTYRELAQAFLEELESRRKTNDGVSRATIWRQEQFNKNMIPAWLRARKLTEIDAEACQKWLDECRTKYAPQTLRNAGSMLKRMLDFAVRKKWVKRNPIRDEPLRYPKEQGDRKRIPSKDELARVLQVLSQRQNNEHQGSYIIKVVSVTIALFAGLRRGEICALQWENVDFDKRVLYVRHTLSEHDGLKSPKTRAGVRDVPMAPQVQAVLSFVKESTGATSGYVLSNRNGRPVDPDKITNQHWQMTMRDAGLLKPDGRPIFTFHALRHAAVSLLIESGLQPIHIKSIVGHEKIATTLDVYGHLFPDDERGRQAINAVAERMAFKPGLKGSTPLRTSRLLPRRDENATCSR